MSSTPSLYRYIDYIGGNILDASNVLLLETLTGRSFDLGLGTLYNSGALLNGVFIISGSSITFQSNDGINPVAVFINYATSGGNSALVGASVGSAFEPLGMTVTIGGSQPSSGASNPLYLNWEWDIITSSDDPTFIDGITGEPTIEAGQLLVTVSWTDNSGTPLDDSTQFAKNLSPIILANFNMSGSPITVSYINQVPGYAWGNPNQAGLVELTDDSGLAPGNTDSRLSNARDPIPGSVYNSSVAALISSGTNSSSLSAWAANTAYAVGNQIVDSNGNIETVVQVSGTGTSGAYAPAPSTTPTYSSITAYTPGNYVVYAGIYYICILSSTGNTPPNATYWAVVPNWNTSIGGTTLDNPGANQINWVNGGTASSTKYDPDTPDQGGIFTDSIIYTTLKQQLTGFLDTVNTSIENALIALSNHIGKPLGSSETHPFPTAFQVGAAPASHVGQVLGLGTSHPAQVDSDHSGFIVLRNPVVTPNPNSGGIPVDSAFELTDGTNNLVALSHLGDVYGSLPNTVTVSGGNGSGGTAVYTGQGGLLSFIAKALGEHVGYRTHGNNNPHNLDAADIGAASEAYVVSAINDIIAGDTAYADAVSQVTVFLDNWSGPSYTVGAGYATFWNNQGEYINNVPFTGPTFMNWMIIELNGGRIGIAIGTGSIYNQQQIPLPQSGTIDGWSYSQMIATASIGWINDHTDTDTETNLVSVVQPNTFLVTIASQTLGHTEQPAGFANVTAVAWRVSAVNPIIISIYDNTADTFNQGTIGDTVTITGRNFGAVAGESVMLFGSGSTSTFISWTTNQIVVVIPSGSTTAAPILAWNPTNHGEVLITSPSVFTII